MRFAALLLVTLAHASSNVGRQHNSRRDSLKKFVENRSATPKVQHAGNTATLAVDSQNGVDGPTSQHTWEVGEWSECSVNCGTGVRERVVSCLNTQTMHVEADAVCSNDPLINTNVKPDTEESCKGACLRCDDHANLFASIGLAAPPADPVNAATGKVCKMTTGQYTCCDKAVEATIVTQIIAIQKGFKIVPKTADEQTRTTIEFISNSTTEFTERLADTKTRLATVEAALNQQTSLKVDKKINRALTIVRDILKQRIEDLGDAVKKSVIIVSSIKAQLGVLMNDKSLDNVQISAGYNATNSRGRKSVLADCVDATVNLFASMSCAACNPAFVYDTVKSHFEGRFKSVNITSQMCHALYKECSPTIRDSRKFLRDALKTMRGIHTNLAKVANRLQPALMALWSSITFDWLPGATRPLASSEGINGQDTYVPDITSLDCIKSSETYVMAQATQEDDFCSNFYSSWNYQFTIQNIVKDVKVGVRAMDALQQCDRCVHLIMSRVGDLLSEGKGGIDVTLGLSPESLSNSGCAGLSSTPAKSAASQIKEQLKAGNLSFFTMTDGDIWSIGERGVLERKSKRAIALILSASKLTSKDNTVSSKTQTAINQATPVVYIHQLNFESDGVEPIVYGNVSWDVVQGAAKNPPPSLWSVRKTSEVPIIATDMNCTSHASCNPESGDAPYWFCATKEVCQGTVPCDDNEREMLQSHAKCVKGLCVDGASAIDGKCPEVAICPITKHGQFDHSYFSKFKNIAPVPPPSGALVAAEGPAMADAITQALNYVSGVCDCAFAHKTDEQGLPTLVVGDKCKYAQCVAYALANENQQTCNSGLMKVCTDLQRDCPNIACDPKQALWNMPVCESKDGANQYALASDVSSALSWSVVMAILAVATLVSL